MKIQILRQPNILGKLAAFALLNSLLVTAALGALPDISVNFVGCCNDAATPAPTSLLATDVAGVVPRANWNNMSGNNVHDAVLNDSNGTPTVVTIYYDADEQWGSGAGLSTPDRKMLNGYLGISNDGHYRPLFLNNVPNGAYKLIMYNGRGTDQQGQGYTVNPASVNTPLHILTEIAFTDVWIRGTSTNPAARDICNYVQFDEVAPVNGTITIDCRAETFRGMMNGLQLIPLDPGAFRFVNQPADATANEGASVSFFGSTVDGTGAVTYQWLTNGVPDTSNLTQTYTRSNLDVNENGRTFALVATDSTSQSVTSRVAVLTVNSLAKLVSATSAGRTNKVYASFGAAVALTGTYTLNNGATVFSAAYGTTHRDIVLDTSILVDGTTYTLTATGETREDNGSLTVPNPTTITFYQGFGGLCTDFASLPAGTALFNNGIANTGYLGDDGTGTNMVVHLTDDGNNGAYGKLFISNRTSGDVLKVLDARWRTRIGGDLGAHADGMSFNWANNLVANGDFIATDEGEGTGVSFTIDTWDGGSGPDTGIEIKWQAARIAFLHIPRTSEGNANFLCKDVFVDTSASVNSAGLATFTYNGNTISATIPGWTGIANGAFTIAARTGGENDNMWIDDLCMNNFTLGPVFFTLQPVDTTVPEFTTATFTAAVDGSPPYYIQWFTNGAPVPGANGTSYTTPPTTAADEGMLVSVVASNDFSTVTSSNATLHLLLNPRVVSVFSRRDAEVHIIYTRAVALASGTYEFDNGGFEQDRGYGADHREVIITNDAPLTANTTYTLTITDVNDEFDPSNVLSPDPTIATFRHGFGPFCADFNDNLVPAGTTLRANLGTSTRVEGGFLHLTDAANDQNGTFFIPDPAGGSPVDRLLVRFRLQLSHPTRGARIADGMSLSIGSDVNSAFNGAEEGGGSGLVVTFDTWDNNAPDTAPALEVRYKGTVAAVQSMAGIREGGRAPNGPFLFDGNGNPLSLDTSNAWANVLISVTPAGRLDLYYKDNPIFVNVQLPNYTPFVGANYSFGARTGGASENAWIDDLCINGFSLGDLVITREPSDVTVSENPPGRGVFSVDVDGLPPYAAQWYSNGVAIAGATGLAYTTPPLNRTADGAGYFAIINNEFNSVTTRVAIVTIVRDLTTPTILSAASDCGTNVYVLFSETLNPASANNPANYTISHGVTVTGASLYGNGRLVVLTVSPPINPNNPSVLTVNGVTDNGPFPNTVNAQAPIAAKGPVNATGANNLIVVEAEDFDVNRSFGTQTPTIAWVIASSLPGYVGSGYVDATPNNSGFGGGDTPNLFTNASRLDYCINFPVAGTYYMWARGSTANDGANNSFHFGIDGVSPDEFSRRVGNRISNWGGDAGNVNAFGWVRDANGVGADNIARIVVASPGVHTMNVWVREDGIRLDRFLLTTDPAFTLTATEPGPAATGRAVTRSLRIVRNADGSATVSWDGDGWTLQCTTNLNPPIVWENVTTGGANSYTLGPSNEFNVFPNALQEVPSGGGRTGHGSGRVTLSNNVLIVDVVYSGLSSNRNNSHFHAAAGRGTNAGVAYNLASIDTGNGATNGTIKGTIPLVDGAYGGKSIDAQLQDLRNGLWYLNIHTDAFPGGEIRGQVDGVPGMPTPARFYRLRSP